MDGSTGTSKPMATGAKMAFAARVFCCAFGGLLISMQTACKNHNYPPPPTPYPPASLSAQTANIAQPPLPAVASPAGTSQPIAAATQSPPGAIGAAQQPANFAASSLPQVPTTGGASVFAQQQTNPQLADLRLQVQQLTESNRQLSMQVSQAQRQAQAFQERSELLAQQLQDATSQNRRLLAANSQANSQYSSQLPATQPLDSQSTPAFSGSTMQASLNRGSSFDSSPGSTRLTANNSLLTGSGAGISPLKIRGAQVFSDRNSTRIRIPADRLFNPGTAQRNPAGDTILVQIAEALINQYPAQRVAIEGHADNTPVSSTYGTAYQLAGAQAQAIMDHLVRRSGVPMKQLYVVAHGPNRPIADNQTAAGRAENRRIEIVINPASY
jgi:chemotaxis protein MotB